MWKNIVEPGSSQMTICFTDFRLMDSFGTTLYFRKVGMAVFDLTLGLEKNSSLILNNRRTFYVSQ
jgi:hypothetical protein